ncbi:MAG TPA: PHB depolymerase family esterase [Pyrinomonadaceae bacterium]|nr:PHB depolymerase family esterase [Pyrinomonadaceae bacterium]
MRYLAALLFTLLTAIPAQPSSADGITKELITSEGKKRAYYLFVPEKLDPASPVPLVVLLHGSGRNGLSLVEKWKELAQKEKLIIVGPDSSDTRGWRVPEDGPDYIHELVSALKTKYPINARRVYLFGHSAGAGQALYMSLLESEYFAATAVHAGALNKDGHPLIAVAKRKIPIAMFIGTNDESVPLTVVRATRDALNGAGFSAELTEIKGHTHWYYDRAPEINRSAWDFLKRHELGAEPHYEKYDFKR